MNPINSNHFTMGRNLLAFTAKQIKNRLKFKFEDMFQPT